MEATYKIIKVGDETFLKLDKRSVNIKHIESIDEIYIPFFYHGYARDNPTSENCYRIRTRGNEIERVCMNNNAANYNFIKELFFKGKDV